MICYDMITKFVRLDVSRPSLAGGVTPHHLCPLTRLTIGILWPMCEEMFRGDCIFSHFLFGFITVNLSCSSPVGGLMSTSSTPSSSASTSSSSVDSSSSGSSSVPPSSPAYSGSGGLRSCSSTSAWFRPRPFRRE